jgi:4-amino-4-deoxy-L-arabinose transferase-like glycosyltransferase
MRLWDESMFAVNTYEMMHNGHYFSGYYEGHPDICNNKPILTVWTQILSAKLFGYNELALRLPSALAAILTIIIVFLFLYRNYSIIWAWSSAMVLLTSAGFIGFHTARTAEADSLLTMFLLISNIFFIQYIRTDKGLYVLYFFLFLTLAFSTKLVAALLFLPALPILLLIFKKFKGFVFNRYFILGILIFLSVNTLLIVLRMKDNPDYLNALLHHDAGRLLQVTDKFSGSFSYYADNLIYGRFSIWFVLLIMGLVMTILQKQAKERNLLIMLFTFTLGYFLVISVSATKVEWYDMPLYPFMAILAAYPIFIFIRKLSTSEGVASPLKIGIILFLIFAYPYYIMFRQSQANSMNGFEKMNEASERFLFEKNKEKADLSGTKVLFTGYNGSLLFYKYKMQDMNQQIELTTKAEFQPNNKVLVSNDSLKTLLQKEYTLIRLDSLDNALLVKIENKKP